MFDATLASTIILFFMTGILCMAAIVSSREIYYVLAKGMFVTAALSTFLLGALRVHPMSAETVVDLASSIWGYFYILSLILAIIAAYLYFSKWKVQWKSFMALAAPFVAIILLISVPFVDSARKFATEASYPLLPAHILLSVLGQLLFFFSFAGSVLYLVMEWSLKSKKFMGITERLPNLESIEKFNSWVTSRSLLLLTLGVALGLAMLSMSFNKLFLGTAKEAHILFSWGVILGIYLLRKRAGISSHRKSIINIVFFIWVMFLFVFTNIFIAKGFHSFQ
jgi:ABC-type uncharacterized transport system permease subunit